MKWGRGREEGEKMERREKEGGLNLLGFDDLLLGKGPTN